jgi:hypothetical protein
MRVNNDLPSSESEYPGPRKFGTIASFLDPSLSGRLLKRVKLDKCPR